MSIYAKGAKGKADRLFSQVVRARGYCQWGDDPTNEWCRRLDLQCAHIVSRRFNNTRTDERNAWSLCSSHHMQLTHNPFDHVVFANRTIGEEVYAELRALALSDRKWKESDWLNECVRLRGLLEAA